MTSFRLKIAKSLLNSLQNDNAATTKFSHLLRTRKATKNFDTKTPQLSLRQDQLGPVLPQNSIEKLRDSNIHTENGELLVKIQYPKFAEYVISDVISKGSDYAYGFENHRFVWSKKGLIERERPDNVLVEFGSPNVAKPLHAGHLRSAVIGQFVANINHQVGNRVHRMNYLGDWGTQFGLLADGYRRFGSETELNTNGLGHLLEIYVKANELTDKEGLTGPTYTKALDFMRQLESGNSEALELWQRFKDISVRETCSIFRRLGIEYDSIEYESDYVAKSKELCQLLESRGLLQYDEDNVGFIEVDEMKIILKKSDETSLYLTRDLAAILNRLDVYDFDRVHYVVDAGQVLHFQKMRKILHFLNCEVAEQDQFQVGFGRVRGMSTRKGTFVHLSHILDEARQRMYDILREKSTTKTTNFDQVAENLALSAVFIQDLKEKRLKDYDFDWKRMLGNKGATGPFLQYGHARLCSLERTFSTHLNQEANFAVLSENEAVRLLQHIAKFDQIVNECYHTLEPHTMVHYLLDLVALSNTAIAKLNIKKSDDELACARMHLFHGTRVVLSNGIRILGLLPLHEM